MAKTKSVNQLCEFIAQACVYAQSHVFGDAIDLATREEMMEPTSMMVACFIAHNTNSGDEGVEWNVIHRKLVKKEYTNDQWVKIINKIVTDTFDGWKI